MNVSINWVSALLGRAVDGEEAAELLSRRAAPVDSVRRVHAELQSLVVGLVEEVGKHPNADRLTLCKVNDGREVVDVVCGAPNVAAGRRYPYAPVGTTLPNGMRLDARKIRGIVSNGMLCSPKELELGPEHDGIMELATDAAPGTPLLHVLPVEDTLLEVDVTPNRPDLLCHKGIARELGAAYGLPIKLPSIVGAPDDSKAPRRVAGPGHVDGIDVVIEDLEGCPRYVAAVIRGVEVAPSPLWLQARLLTIGARPINNIVDVTNYLLFELNQPLHAFDYHRLRGQRLEIRRPRRGERLTTLDGQERALTTGMTMICDADGPTAIGGVMGGADSEVTSETTDVVLECAYFDPKRIRETRKALRLTTEASYRFERGTDIQAIPEVVRRAVSMIRAVAGGREVEVAADVYPKPAAARTVFLRPQRVAHLLGVALPREELEQLLGSVGFTVAPKDGRLAAQVPGWRPDVTREVDLIEEVARLHGYDAFPVELRPFRPSAVPDDPSDLVKRQLRDVLTGMGLYEARCLPLVPDGGPGAAALLNPLSAEEAFLRRRLLPGLVRSAEHNWANRVRDIRLFEIGATFRDRGAELPEESLRCAGVISGARVPPHWSDGSNTPDYDAWDVRELLAQAARVGGADGSVEANDHGWALVDTAGTERGWAGRLSADSPVWAAPLYGFEFDLDVHHRDARQFRALPTTPPVKRDLALVLPAGVTARQLTNAMRQVGGDLLERLTIFDQYQSAALHGRSVAWRLVFRAPDRTLRDKEVDKIVERILEHIKEHFGVDRREA